jgi:hypothetical protein
MSHMPIIACLRLTLLLQLTLLACASSPEVARRDCRRLPSCQGYLDQVRQSVYQNRAPGDSVSNGNVTIAFRFDPQGRLNGLRIVRSDSEELAQSCMSAMQAAELPPVPEDLTFLLEKEIMATFGFQHDSP